jgi:hypothetical protein
VIDNVGLAMMFFIFGREVLMDISDLPGDGKTFVRLLGEKLSTRVGFASQFLAILLLFFIVDGMIQWIILIFLFVSYLLLIILWIRVKFRPTVIHAMKAQALTGLVFLLQ